MLSITDDTKQTLLVKREDIDNVHIGNWCYPDYITDYSSMKYVLNVLLKTKNGYTKNLYFFQEKPVLEKHYRRIYNKWYREYMEYEEHIGCCWLRKNPNPRPVLDSDIEDAIISLKQKEKEILETRRNEIIKLFYSQK
jgi:hypothetical protein